MTRLHTVPMMLLFSITATACVDSADPTVESDVPDRITWRDQRYDRADRTSDGLARLPDSVTTATVDSLQGRSREELAELLRMTILHPSGSAYTSTEPNWSAADATLAAAVPLDRVPKQTTRARPSDPGSYEAALERITTVTTDEVNLVIGSDGRALSPATSDPFRAIARVDVFTSPTGGGFRTSCTGAYIGPFTFVLAGHCLRFTDGSFARRIVFQPARTGGSLPFGQFDCRNGDASSSNDFLAAVPAGFNGTLDNSLDFAVIDTFPCHSTGRHFNGYAVNTGTTTYNVHGYPLGRCPNASAEGTFMCGMADTGYVNDWRLESQLDATDGQDGAPWWPINPVRVAGVHVGYREYFDFGRCGFSNCRRNYARRIDNAMDTFIRAIAFDF